jgi:hypothetical protein
MAIQTRRIHNAGHRPYARAGNHIDDDAMLIEGIEHTQVRHAAGSPAPQGDADPDAPQVMHAFHPVGQNLPQEGKL